MPDGGVPAEAHAAVDSQIEDLVRQYGRLIRHIVCSIARRRTDLVADDVEQQVVVALWRRLKSEQTIDHPSSYIYRAAVRETVRAVRAEVRRDAQSSDLETVDDISVSDKNPHAALEVKERSAVLRRCVDELQPERRRAVQAHLAGFDVQEIMQMNDWTYQKARNLIARGMADLRTHLREGGIDG